MKIRQIYEMSDKHNCSFIFQRAMNEVSINPCKWTKTPKKKPTKNCEIYRFKTEKAYLS